MARKSAVGTAPSNDTAVDHTPTNASNWVHAPASYELLFIITAVRSNQPRLARMVSWNPTEPFSPSPSKMNTKLRLQVSGTGVAAFGDLVTQKPDAENTPEGAAQLE